MSPQSKYTDALLDEACACSDRNGRGLHRVLSSVTSDSAGHASASIKMR